MFGEECSGTMLHYLPRRLERVIFQRYSSLIREERVERVCITFAAKSSLCCLDVQHDLSNSSAAEILKATTVVMDDVIVLKSIKGLLS